MYLVGIGSSFSPSTIQVSGRWQLVTAHDRDLQIIRCSSGDQRRLPDLGRCEIAVSINPTTLVLKACTYVYKSIGYKPTGVQVWNLD